MFICAITGKSSLPQEPMIKIVVETRKVSYSNMIEGENGLEEKVSFGTEIVREIGVTKEGYAEWLKEHGE